MAYRNSEGRVTIDEAVARSDIRKEAQAVQVLRNAESKLKQVISESHSYQGETAKAIAEKAHEMLTRTQKLIRNLEDAQAYTKRVVNHYKEVDRKCKEALQNTTATK